MKWLWLTVAVLVGCQAPSEDRRAFNVPDLKPVKFGTITTCWVEKSTADPFEATDPIYCEISKPPTAPLKWRVDVSVTGGYQKSYTEQDFGQKLFFDKISRKDWPLTLNITTVVTLTEGSGIVRVAAERAGGPDDFAAVTPLELVAPFELWQVSLVAEPALAEAYKSRGVSSKYGFPVESAPLQLAGSEPGAEIMVNRNFGTVVDLPSTLWFPVPVVDDFQLPLAVQSRAGKTTFPIAGPGYYALTVDGGLRPATPEDLPAEPVLPVDPPVDPPVTPLEPCGDNKVCAEGEVCVGESCFPRAQQKAGAACDHNANGDCAEGYVCVNDRCASRASQKGTFPCDNDDNGDCAEGYVCVNDRCANKAYQKSGYSCDNNDNGDCAADYVCVNGACAGKAFQKNGSSCDNNDNNDCAADYVCVNAVCRGQAYQKNGAECDNNDDGDCAQYHVCVKAKCRQQVYQQKGAECDAGDDSDCAQGLTCQSEVCG